MSYEPGPLAFMPNETLIRQPVLNYQKIRTEYQAGRMNAAHFRMNRIQMGIHLQRAPSTRYMVRVKIPYGLLSANQLRTLASLVPAKAPDLHITTRQAIELHDVRPDTEMELLEQLAAVGLTTRDAGGNSVRNVASCPLLGTCPWQAFDAVSATRCLVRSFLGSSTTEALPRKLKVAVSGCSQDCAAARLQDIGLVATQLDGISGFRVFVGGGIGAAPMVGVPLAFFVPQSALVPFVAAVADVFNQRGTRIPRHRARLKWLVAETGEVEIRRMVRAAYCGKSAQPVVWATEHASVSSSFSSFPRPTAVSWASALHLDDTWIERRLWREQHGRWAMALTWPGGSFSSRQAQLAADWADTYGNGLLSTTTLQQLVIHGIAEASGPALIEAVERLEPNQVRSSTTVVSCPGAPYCNLAITRSGAMARAITAVAEQTAEENEALRLTPPVIRICGCPHACSHVRFADLGLMGGAAKLGGSMIPIYRLWLGGREDQEMPERGIPTVRIPAQRVPQAIARLFRAYAADALKGESFSEWSRRHFMSNDNRREVDS
ncbi:MAG: nitrite/sulfite reductase [Firmicutes bacterium]|nr:nitrite/sulfite reductase [Bacillota bacterium]